MPIAIVCRGVRFDEGFRADIIVESKVIIELKSVERITKAHKKQLPTYLKLTGMKLGCLLSFGEDMMKRGITRRSTAYPNERFLGDLGVRAFDQILEAHPRLTKDAVRAALAFAAEALRADVVYPTSGASS